MRQAIEDANAPESSSSGANAAHVLVSGCQSVTENAVDRKLQDVNVVAESELSDVMLTVADPNEAVDYFARLRKIQRI